MTTPSRSGEIGQKRSARSAVLGANQTYTFSCERGWSSPWWFLRATFALTLGSVVLCVVRLSASQRLLEAKRRGGRIAL